MLTQGLHNKTTLLTPGFTQGHMDFNKKVDHVFPAQGRGNDQSHTATTPSARGLGTGSWALRGGRASSGTGSGTRSTRPWRLCSGDVTVDIPRPVAPVGVLVEHGAPWAGFYDDVSVDAPIVDGAVTGVPEPLAFGTTLATRN